MKKSIKNILGFYSGLILSNIYFAIEDNKKLNNIKLEYENVLLSESVNNHIKDKNIKQYKTI